MLYPEIKAAGKWNKHLDRPDLYEKKWTDFFKNLSISKDSNILDFGCGSGASVYIGLKLGFKNLIGLEIDYDFLFKKAKIPGIPINYKAGYKALDIEKFIVLNKKRRLPFVDNKFKAIIFSSSITKDFNIWNDKVPREEGKMVTDSPEYQRAVKRRLNFRAKECARISRVRSIWYINPKKQITKFFSVVSDLSLKAKNIDIRSF